MAQHSELKDASGAEYRGSIFAIQASAAFVKAIIFIAEARVANKSRQFMWAAIASYYSLFHLTISLMFMAPKLIKQQKLNKLIADYEKGVDPTYLIKHRELENYLQNCESGGLTDQLRKQLLKSRELREFVNYKPRIEWEGDKIIFRTKAYKLTELQNVIGSVEPLLTKSLLWAKKQDESSEFVAQMSVILIRQFLTQDDLIYKDWCPPQILDEAELIRQNLPIKVQY